MRQLHLAGARRRAPAPRPRPVRGVERVAVHRDAAADIGAAVVLGLGVEPPDAAAVGGVVGGDHGVAVHGEDAPAGDHGLGGDLAAVAAALADVGAPGRWPARRAPADAPWHARGCRRPAASRRWRPAAAAPRARRWRPPPGRGAGSSPQSRVPGSGVLLVAEPAVEQAAPAEQRAGSSSSGAAPAAMPRESFRCVAHSPSLASRPLARPRTPSGAVTSWASASRVARRVVVALPQVDQRLGLLGQRVPGIVGRRRAASAGRSSAAGSPVSIWCSTDCSTGGVAQQRIGPTDRSATCVHSASAPGRLAGVGLQRGFAQARQRAVAGIAVARHLGQLDGGGLAAVGPAGRRRCRARSGRLLPPPGRSAWLRATSSPASPPRRRPPAAAAAASSPP